MIGHHHTAICDRRQPKKYEGDEIQPGEAQTHHINAEMCDIGERRNRTIKILLDLGSQKTYVSQRMADALKLKPICEEHMIIKTFGNTVGKPMTVKERLWCPYGLFHVRRTGSKSSK